MLCVAYAATTQMSDAITPQVAEVVSCHFCPDSTNLHTCIKCKIYFCAQHASRISPQFCQDCFKEVTLLVEKYNKVEQEWDEETDTTFERRSTCRRLRLDGPDYVFYNLVIQSATEEELTISHEFHKFMVSRLEHELMVRTVKESNRIARESPKVPKLKTVSTTESHTRKKREVKPMNLEAMLRKQGLSEDIIKSMLAAASATPSNSNGQ